MSSLSRASQVIARLLRTRKEIQISLYKPSTSGVVREVEGGSKSFEYQY